MGTETIRQSVNPWLRLNRFVRARYSTAQLSERVITCRRNRREARSINSTSEQMFIRSAHALFPAYNFPHEATIDKSKVSKAAEAICLKATASAREEQVCECVRTVG